MHTSSGIHEVPSVAQTAHSICNHGPASMRQQNLLEHGPLGSAVIITLVPSAGLQTTLCTKHTCSQLRGRSELFHLGWVPQRKLDQEVLSLPIRNAETLCP